MHIFRALFIAFSAVSGLASSSTFGFEVNVVDPVPPSFRINSNGQFVDQFGRVRIFHGVNAVFKADPWIPSTDSTFDWKNSLNQIDIANLKQWGFNVVRLGVMWPGVEPSKNNYNNTYLELIDTLIENLGKSGITTIADFHQDLLHPQYCGEGIPAHALMASDTSCSESILGKIIALFGGCKSFDDYKIPIDPSTGYPQVEGCLNTSFALFYATPQLSSAFQNLYTQSDLKQSLINYWSQVSLKLSSNPYVLGFDLFNEPWPGNIWRDPELIIPGEADKKYLQPLYQDIHKAIRLNSNDTIIFYEGVQFPDSLPILNGIISHTGFTESPGGPEYNDRQALSYHVYCCAFGATNCDKAGDPTTAVNAECDKKNLQKVDVRYQDAERVGGGAFLTEFGACSNSEQCIKEIRRSTSAADTHLGSWAYWQFKFFNDVTTQSGVVEGFYNNDGTLQTEKVSELSRTYAQAIQGNPTNMTYNPDTKSFTLDYVSSSSVTAPTIIYLNLKMNYPNGFKVEIAPASVTWTQSDYYIVINHPNNFADQTVQISITA